jgi:hypothetical protein
VCVAAIHAHHVLLIAGVAVPRALKRYPFSIVAEVGFGVFSAKRQLMNCLEMPFTR